MSTDLDIIERALGKCSSPNAQRDGYLAVARLRNDGVSSDEEPSSPREDLARVAALETQVGVLYQQVEDLKDEAKIDGENLRGARGRIQELEAATADATEHVLEVDALNAKIARLEARGIEDMQAEIKALKESAIDVGAQVAYAFQCGKAGAEMDWENVPDVQKAQWRAAS